MAASWDGEQNSASDAVRVSIPGMSVPSIATDADLSSAAKWTETANGQKRGALSAFQGPETLAAQGLHTVKPGGVMVLYSAPPKWGGVCGKLKKF